ncbi:unnamed protein product [Rotaria magnacalcarata]|uniref:C2H2-type domain-containing protein n=1 Tax=Rotaria magnacalcarata TaxID=392030 RepID=A0A8S2V0M1_9BILA|nr:unnamed protein product [Rotaria magnacalcarata]CAF4419187.1 unnamed protein product [Rotaria magnacalcarata]
MKKKLKRLEDTRLSQAKHRNNKQLTLKRLIEKHPNVAQEYSFSLYDQARQPRVEQRAQSALLSVIVEIASRGAAADSTRNSNLISPCMALDDLSERLKLRGFVLSRSTTYLRLLPRLSNSTEGKRHVQTVPARLIKASNDEHKSHDDQYFATNIINHLKILAGSFGLPAARRQAPLLMHLDYKIRLPDHAFVVAPRHKLIPSVMKVNGKCKPIVIICVDGENTLFYKYHANFIFSCKCGPDENPRYSETLAGGVNLFKKYELYCFFMVTNCPDRSAFNMVERKMAPLSNQLADKHINFFVLHHFSIIIIIIIELILPYDHYGSHLDNGGNTIDTELEIRNFKRAGNCLAEVWVSSPLIRIQLTSYSKIIAERFLPAPFTFKVSPSGISVAELNNKHGRFVDLLQRLQFDNILATTNAAYDYNCPSVQRELQQRTCSNCASYHPSAVAMKRHKRIHSPKDFKEQQKMILKTKQQSHVIDCSHSKSEEAYQNIATLPDTINPIHGAPLIENIFDFLASDFIEI